MLRLLLSLLKLAPELSFILAVEILHVSPRNRALASETQTPNFTREHTEVVPVIQSHTEEKKRKHLFFFFLLQLSVELLCPTLSGNLSGIPIFCCLSIMLCLALTSGGGTLF